MHGGQTHQAAGAKQNPLGIDRDTQLQPAIGHKSVLPGRGKAASEAEQWRKGYRAQGTQTEARRVAKRGARRWEKRGGQGGQWVGGGPGQWAATVRGATDVKPFQHQRGRAVNRGGEAGVVGRAEPAHRAAGAMLILLLWRLLWGCCCICNCRGSLVGLLYGLSCCRRMCCLHGSLVHGVCRLRVDGQPGQDLLQPLWRVVPPAHHAAHWSAAACAAGRCGVAQSTHRSQRGVGGCRSAHPRCCCRCSSSASLP
jgi:hypothetical protein